MADTLDAQVELAIAYDPPGDSEDLFGIDEETIWRVLGAVLGRVGVTCPVEVSILVTDDAGLRQLNREYRGIDEATDVLSFPQLDEPLVEAPAEQLWQAGAILPHVTLLDEDLIADDELEDLGAAEGTEDEATGTEDEGADAEDTDLDGDDELAVHLGDIALSREAVVRQATQAGHAPAWECAYLVAHGVLHLVGYDDHTEAGYHAMVGYQEEALAEVGVAKH